MNTGINVLENYLYLLSLVKYFVTVSVFHCVVIYSQEIGPGRQTWLYYINIELFLDTDSLKGNRLVYAYSTVICPNLFSAFLCSALKPEILTHGNNIP